MDMPSPDSNFITPYPISGDDTVAFVQASGSGDDWDNLQYALNELCGKDGAKLYLTGQFYSAKPLFAIDPKLSIIGAGINSTVINAGAEGSKILLHSDDDAAEWNPSAWPDLLSARTDSNGRCYLTVKNLTMQTQDVAGYTALGYGLTMKNAQVRHLLRVSGRYPVQCVFNVPLDFSGGDTASLGATNVQEVQIFAAANDGTTRYVPTTDFTVDNATGIVTRIPAGDIPAGTVYAHYNDVQNRTTVERMDLTVDGCRFKGRYRYVEGAEWCNVDSAIGYRSGISYSLETTADNVFHNFVIQDGDGHDGFWYSEEESVELSEETGPTQWTPFNGNLTIKNVDIQDCTQGAWVDSVEGAPSGESPYTYTNSVTRPLVKFSNNTYRNIGQDAFGFGSIAFDQIAGIQVILDKETHRDVNSAYDLATGVQYDGQRLSGWRAAFDGEEASTWLIDSPNVRVRWNGQSGDFSIFTEHAINLGKAHDGLTWISDDPIVLRNCLIHRPLQHDQSGGSMKALRIFRTSAVTVQHCIMSTAFAAGTAVSIVDAHNTHMSGCDFSNYLRLSGETHVHLDSDSSDAVIHLRSTDVYWDEGTDNTITGGLIFGEEA